MTSALYFILLFSGLWTLSFCESHQFFVVKENKNWTEAQKYCRENYTDLAVIESPEEMKTVKAALQGETGDFWIGLKFINNTIHNTAYGVWTNGRNLSYSYWAEGEPNNGVGVFCVQIQTSKQGKWNDAGCQWNVSFVCYRKIPWILIKENKTWGEALKYCRENHEDLVSVHNRQIQEWVGIVMKNASTPHVWMGLCYTCTLGFWFWVGGEDFGYQNWAQGYGAGEDCSSGDRTGVVEFGNMKWVSQHPTTKFNFICTTK